MEYNNTSYTAADKFFDSLENFIPDSLFQFLWMLISHGKETKNLWHRKVVALSHNILSSMKTRKCMSPLQLGLAVTLYHRYGSKDLINILSTLGFCASYSHVQLFQASALTFQGEPVLEKCFSQFVFDNADHNVCTLDGFNTFHYMGGIQVVIPHDAIKHQVIPKLNKLPKSKTFIKKGVISIKSFKKDSKKQVDDLTYMRNLTCLI